MSPSIMVMTLNLVLECEPGDFPGVTEDEIVKSVIKQLSNSVMVVTEKLIPYRIAFVSAPK